LPEYACSQLHQAASDPEAYGDCCQTLIFLILEKIFGSVKPLNFQNFPENAVWQQSPMDCKKRKAIEKSKKKAVIDSAFFSCSFFCFSFCSFFYFFFPARK